MSKRLLPHRLRLAYVGWLVWMCRKWKDEQGREQRHFYRWGGDGPERFDCSGLVLYGATQFGARDFTKSWNCDRMWRAPEWRKLEMHQLEPGDLVFYGSPERATHVMVWAGDGSVIGASGGDSGTTDDMVARVRNAYVKRKERHDYRPDVLGFKRNELLAGLCSEPTFVAHKE